MPLVHAHDAIRNHALTWAGVHSPARPMPPLEELRRGEAAVFATLDRLCLNRLIVGSFRYGRAGTAGKPGGKPAYDYTGDVIRRVEQYQQTGDLEMLIDAVNLLKLEYVDGQHPLAHFGTGDDGQHTPVKGP